MKAHLFVLFVLISILGGTSWALNVGEEQLECPICHNLWTQRVAESGSSWGIRLDYRPFGPTASPWTLPQCPKCGFVLYEHDVTKIPVDKLGPYILSDAYMKAAHGSPPYACLALIDEQLGAEPMLVAWAYLRASWQTEAKPVECRKYLEKALQVFTTVRDAPDVKVPQLECAAFICPELERRLGRYAEARKMFQKLHSNKIFQTKAWETAIQRELHFIARQDSTPHAMVAADEKRLQQHEEW